MLYAEANINHSSFHSGVATAGVLARPTDPCNTASGNEWPHVPSGSPSNRKPPAGTRASLAITSAQLGEAASRGERMTARTMLASSSNSCYHLESSSKCRGRSPLSGQTESVLQMSAWRLAFSILSLSLQTGASYIIASEKVYERAKGWEPLWFCFLSSKKNAENAWLEGKSSRVLQ